MSNVNAANIPQVSRKKSRTADFMKRLIKEKPLGTFGAVILLIIVLAAIFANVLAPFGVNEINLGDRLLGPTASHLMGTDNLGRDVFSRILYGARISIIVGFGAALLDVVVATIIGTISGFIGGKFDMVVQRFVDAWLCLPLLIVALCVMSLAGPGLAQVTLTVGIVWGVGGSRIPRGAVLAIKQNMYMDAAKSLGASRMWMLVRHIFPNIAAPLIVLFTMAMGGAILTEATLSFLGFGVPPPEPSWGGMLSAEGRNYMLQSPGMALWPGLVLSLTVFGINVLGDAIRDLLDPRLRGGLGRYGGTKQKKEAKKKQEQLVEGT